MERIETRVWTTFMCAGMTHSCRIRTFVLSHEDTETIRVVPSKSLPTPASMPFDSTSGTPDRMMRLLLKRKSEQIHLALLATVAAFACVYTLANYYTGNTNHISPLEALTLTVSSSIFGVRERSGSVTRTWMGLPGLAIVEICFA